MRDGVHRGHVDDKRWVRTLPVATGAVPGCGTANGVRVQTSHKAVEHDTAEESDSEMPSRQGSERCGRVCVILENQRHIVLAGRLGQREDIVTPVQQFGAYVEMRVHDAAFNQVTFEETRVHAMRSSQAWRQASNCKRLQIRPAVA